MRGDFWAIGTETKAAGGKQWNKAYNIWVKGVNNNIHGSVIRHILDPAPALSFVWRTEDIARVILVENDLVREL